MTMEKFTHVVESEAHKYVSGVFNPDDLTDEIVFMRVNCRKHLNFCTNKMWSGRILPAAEVYFLNEKDQVEMTDMNDRHRSGPGLESFFVQNGLLDDKMNPESALERAGKKYLD